MRASRDLLGLEEVPTGPVEPQEVFGQLENMLAHTTFRRSERCSALFSFLVREAVEDPEIHFKERILGIEVFGRPADYDTAEDPIVRVTISDIKKRIGLYYHEPGHKSELRIELLPGSYTPKFFPPSPGVSSTAVEEVEKARFHLAVPENETSHFRSAPQSWKHKLWTAGAIASVFAIAVSTAFFARYRAASTGYEQFWRPFVTSRPRVLLCTARLHTAPGQLLDNSSNISAALSALPAVPVLPWGDVRALMKVISRLHRKSQFFVMRDSQAISFKDLRDGPVILIGEATNPWSKQLSSNLRFRLTSDPLTRTASILDTQNPANHKWIVHLDDKYNTSSRDFAVISNYYDAATGTSVLQLAGLGPHGTEAAGDFIGVPKYLNSLQPRLKGCKNYQIVLETRVVSGGDGTPTVDDVYCW